jgi:hypothetical protein
MEAQSQPSELQTLADAMSDMRDSLVLISMCLKDYLANQPSQERDQVMAQVEQQLLQIRDSASRQVTSAHQSQSAPKRQ